MMEFSAKSPLYQIAFIVFFVATLVFGVGLRMIFALESREDFDEDDYLSAARAFYEAGSLANYPDVDNNTEHPPLVKILFSLTLNPAELNQIPESVPRSSLTELPPDTLRWARHQAVLVGSLTLLVVGLLISPLAMLALAVNSVHLHYSSVAYLDPFGVLGLTLMSTAFVYSLRAEGRRRWWAFGLSAVAFGAAVAVKYPFALAGVMLILFALVYRHYKLLPLVGWGLLAIAVFWVLNPYLWVDPFDRAYGQLSYHDAYTETYAAPHTYSKHLEFITSHADHIVHWRGHPFFVFTDWLLFLCAVPGVALLLRHRSYYGWWLLGGFLFLSIWETQWRQHLMLIIVPYAYSVALGLAWWRDQLAAMIPRVVRRADTKEGRALG
ncbi:MAG: hypothetical protein ACLFTK_04280 [Anaerolineales bacterium]